METIKQYISDVEDSDTPIVITIKNLVNDYISINFLNHGTSVSFEERDKVVWLAYSIYYKKYYHDSRYVENPSFIIRQIIQSYYTTLNLKFGNLKI